ncbi:hypothetical protein [Absidia glauca]|uniref:Uncharacterized protein n=1 Tax=Absidia glauca TaxID=4829 RepID=A0A163KZR0_ABSGL|nr:hypothetical protein [Absidia glauca]
MDDVSRAIDDDVIPSNHYQQQQQQHLPASTSTSSSTSTSEILAPSSAVTPLPTQHQAAVSGTTDDKITHPEWGVMKDQEFHPLAHKHQCDLENLYQTNSALSDFYFWQASLGGYCMADMVQNIVVSSDQAFVLVRQIVDGAPPPGRKKKSKNKI